MDNPSETTPRSGGIIGAALLMAVLFALVLGVYGAVSIDTFRPARMQPTAPPAPSTATVSPSPAPAVAIPPGQVNPAAGRTFEAAKPAYWVEYGAYRGSFYAHKLVERLGAIGLKAEIVRVRGAGGALYYSVHSNATGDRSNADANAKLAAQLGIAPLLHRGDNPAVARPVVAKIAAPAATSPAAHYWVQFGAYNTPRYATALRDQLHRSGIDVTILERHQPGYARYLVRTRSSLGRDQAHGLAARGQSILGIQPLVGQAPAPAA
ncbi:MAG TPA: SPOR domain-containing protein [Stellaceae bacterium]|nr:SPOR domain-containing protein [Stellaceae bacterium]